MSAEHTLFIEPLDVLFLRGNKLFGDPGSYGESLVPPWPSVAAGAIRSRMLVDDRIDLFAFAAGKVEHPQLGTPTKPGSFRVTAFHLARRGSDGCVEALFQPPADLVIAENEEGKPFARALMPLPCHSLLSSSPFPLLPFLAEAKRNKPAGGYWLAESGWRKYLAGQLPVSTDLVKSSALWSLDHRVGIGLDAGTRSVADGKLFTVQAVAMQPGMGFLAAVNGATLPQSGMLRLGGDGRAAAMNSMTNTLPKADYEAIAHAGRCRLVLTTPGIFPGGSTLPGVATGGVFQLGDVQGRVVCAAVPRAEVISGWDLAVGAPKLAQRVVPAGAVYWLEQLEATPQALRNLVEQGLWSNPCEDAPRRAEGFNRVALAHWQ